LMIIVLVILSSTFLNAAINDTFVSAIFSIAYLVFLAFSYKLCKNRFTTDKVVETIKLFTFVEIICTLAIAITGRIIKAGDIFCGTLGNAHFLGLWLSMSIIYLVYYWRSKKISLLQVVFNKSYLPTLVSLVLMLYLADAKGVLLTTLIALVVLLFIRLFSKRERNALLGTILVIYVGGILVLYILTLEPVRRIISLNIPYISPYLYQRGWNGKFGFFYGTVFESLKGLRLIFGYGLGQYGSRFANAFAYNIMYRDDTGINGLIASLFAPHYVEEYARYISYYNNDFVNQIRWRSAVLSYPFSSYVTLIAETGIFGVVSVSYYLNKLFRKSRFKMIIIYFLAACLLDLYFDHFQCVFAVIVFISSCEKETRS